MRIIDADEMRKQLDEKAADFEGRWFLHDHIEFAKYWLDKMPTIDAEQVKHGHWIGVEYDDNDLSFVIKCSECGEVFEKIEDGNWNYCPNCGAKMEGRKE